MTGHSEDPLRGALRRLVTAARTSGGVAGRDDALCAACDDAEARLEETGGFSDELRARLREDAQAIEDAEAALDAAMRPFRAVESAIAVLKELLLERYGVEIAGNCEGCERLLIVGDQGLRYEEGELSCAACAPTWGNAEEEWNERRRLADPDGYTVFKDSLSAHLAAGGSRNDKVTHRL